MGAVGTGGCVGRGLVRDDGGGTSGDDDDDPPPGILLLLLLALRFVVKALSSCS